MASSVSHLKTLACAAARRAGANHHHGLAAARSTAAATRWARQPHANGGASAARPPALGAPAPAVMRAQGARRVSCAAASSSISAEDRAAAVRGVEAAALAWSQAVSALSVPEVVGLYAPEDAVLLGTVDTADDGIRIGKDKIKAYFDGFLDKEKISPLFPAFDEADVLVLSPEAAIYNGYYTFELTPKAGDAKPSKNRRGFLRKLLFWRSAAGGGSGMKIAKAKFSFLYRRDDAGAWKIVTHNSGFTPEGLLDG